MTIEKSLHSTGQLSNKVEGVTKVNSIQKTARFAGVLYLIITIFAIVAHIYMPSKIIVAGDAAATVVGWPRRAPRRGSAG